MIFRSPYPDVAVPDLPLTAIVLRHAERLADKPAVVDGQSGRILTYRQLAEAVRRTAAGLARWGFRKGDVFAIYAPNVPEYAVAFHGAASLGGVITMLSPRHTVEEAVLQLTDAGATHLLTVPELLGRARAAAQRAGIRNLFVIGNASGVPSFASLLERDDEPPTVRIDPRTDVAILTYSSGTTGGSKGVMLTHANLVANVVQVLAVARVDEDDVLIGALPFAHMYGIHTVLQTGLAAGATIVVSPWVDLESFLTALRDHAVTYAHLVPPIVVALAKSPLVRRDDYPKLAVIVSAAAPLGAEVVRACADRLGCRVRQAYGLTEAGPGTHFPPLDAAWDRPGSVGYCLPNTECQLVDPATGAVAGRGQTGEIWVRGPQVMKGYRNQPESTATAITPDGWLRTGDLGHADADGALYVVDRLKELIKYKGYSVAPAELEAVLLAHPAVADAAVIPSPDEAVGEVPKAFVVLKAEATAEELMAFVTARVAPYKKVRKLAVVDQIPKSPSGKILRRILIEAERARISSSSG